MMSNFKRIIHEDRLFIAFLGIYIASAIVIFPSLHWNVFVGDGIYYFDYLSSLFNDGAIRVTKYPIGTPLMELPFFMIAKFLGHFFSPEAIGGWGGFFLILIYAGGSFYYMVGACAIYAMIKKLYGKIPALITVALLTYGTPIIFYATYYVSFSHIYGFCLVSVAMLYIMKYDEMDEERSNKLIYAIVAGWLAGMITLIRNTNIIIVFAFLLYGVTSLPALGARIKKYFTVKRIAGYIIGFFIAVLPQLIVWKVATGHFITYSYEGESFSYLLWPNFDKIFFSDAKGLFIYSPLLFIIVITMILYWRDMKEQLAATAVILGLITYISAAWWCWWLGGCYSQRMYVDMMCMFAFPLGALCRRLLEKKDGERSMTVVRASKCFVMVALCATTLLNMIWIAGISSGEISSNLATWYELSRWMATIVGR